MNQSPEQLALQHHMALCQGHAEALQDVCVDALSKHASGFGPKMTNCSLMRLPPAQIDTIQSTVHALLGEGAQLKEQKCD